MVTSHWAIYIVIGLLSLVAYRKSCLYGCKITRGYSKSVPEHLSSPGGIQKALKALLKNRAIYFTDMFQ